MKKYKIQIFLEYLETISIEYDFFGNQEQVIKDYCPFKKLKNSRITWIRKMKSEYLVYLDSYDDLFVITDTLISSNVKGNFLCVSNPQKVFFKIIEKFFVDSTTRSGTKKIGENCTIGNFVYISPEVILGNNIRIDHNVTIEGKVFIDDNTIIESGVVIGLCGFGHYKENDGTSVRVPHLGGVRIGKNCYIGANCTIARGTLSDTIIGNDVKIDALCHIAHNDEIGNKVMITGGVIISGSTTIKDEVWIGPNTTINNGLVIGQRSFIGIGSVVIEDVPDGKLVYGSPAKVIRDNSPNIYNT